MTRISSDRHKYLLQYLNRLTQNSCPAYLRNDQDDIAQTALIRLIEKINNMTSSLEECCFLLQNNKASQEREPLIKILHGCLEEIDKSWNRKHSGPARSEIAESFGLFMHDHAPGQRDKLLAALKGGLFWLHANDGRHIFADFYIEKGVHWAIMDVKKRRARLAEVSPEEQEDGSLEWGVSHEPLSWQRSLVIRQEIADCLSRLDEDKRRPTLLALLGYQYREIAGFLELSVPQTDSRVRRGKAFLRKCLDHKGVSP